MENMEQLSELVKQLLHSRQQELSTIMMRLQQKAWEESNAYLARLEDDQMFPSSAENYNNYWVGQQCDGGQLSRLDTGGLGSRQQPRYVGHSSLDTDGQLSKLDTGGISKDGISLGGGISNGGIQDGILNNGGGGISHTFGQVDGVVHSIGGSGHSFGGDKSGHSIGNGHSHFGGGTGQSGKLGSGQRPGFGARSHSNVATRCMGGSSSRCGTMQPQNGGVSVALDAEDDNDSVQPAQLYSVKVSSDGYNLGLMFDR